jgi:putative endonuclease
MTWHADTLVFVEVRAHAEEPHRSPAETISPAKQRRVVRAAQWYMMKRLKRQPPPPCRFDVVWLTARGAEIVDGGVIEGAFTA